MLEREITGKVGKALRDDTQFKTCAFEVKLARGKTLYKGEVKEHQKRNLGLAYWSSIYYKIPDVGMDQKPFDGFVLKGTEAYVVIWFQISQKAHEVWALSVVDLPEGKIGIEYARKHGKRVNC